MSLSSFSIFFLLRFDPISPRATRRRRIHRSPAPSPVTASPRMLRACTRVGGAGAGGRRERFMASRCLIPFLSSSPYSSTHLPRQPQPPPAATPLAAAAAAAARPSRFRLLFARAAARRDPEPAPAPVPVPVVADAATASECPVECERGNRAGARPDLERSARFTLPMRISSSVSSLMILSSCVSSTSMTTAAAAAGGGAAVGDGSSCPGGRRGSTWAAGTASRRRRTR